MKDSYSKIFFFALLFFFLGLVRTFAQPSSSYYLRVGGGPIGINSQAVNSFCVSSFTGTQYGFSLGGPQIYTGTLSNCGGSICAFNGTSAPLTINPSFAGSTQSINYISRSFAYSSCNLTTGTSSLVYVINAYTHNDLTLSTPFPSTLCSSGSALNLSSYISIDPAASFLVSYILDGNTIGSTLDPSTLAVGTHSLFARVNWSNGTTTHLLSNFTVIPNPSIITSPSDQVGCSIGPRTFTVNATGTALNYQWQERLNNTGSWNSLSDGGGYSGTDTNVLTVPGTANLNFYRCVVSNSCFSTTSGEARADTFSQVAVTASPSNQLGKCIGSSASFSASGTPRNGAIQYRWQYWTGSAWTDLGDGNDGTGTIFSGVSTSTFTISNLRVGYNGYQFRCRLFDNCGNLTENTTSAATLSVFSAVSIGVQPADKQACLGSNTSFSVGATAGNGGLSYRWERQSGSVYLPIDPDANFQNVDSHTLTITNVFSGLNGNRFRCFIWDACGQGNGLNSTAALLTTLSPVSVPTSPAPATQCVGTTVTFSSTSSGSGLSYQWQQDGVDMSNSSVVSGATTPTLTLTGISAGLNGKTYRLKATGTCNTEYSPGALLTVNSPANITTQPAASTTLCVGAGYTISVIATGTITGYQWRKNGINITGATSATFSIASTSTADAGNYDVVISGPCAPFTVTSGSAALIINTPVAVSSQPTASTTLCAGAGYNISVSATGTITGYQWRKNGTNIPGATASTFSISTTATSDAGNYDVVISGPCGNATSNPAGLTVNTPVVITVQPPASIPLCLGSGLTVSVTATGTITGYQWRKNGTNIPGATAATFAISSTTVADGGNYDVVISGPCGNATSNIATTTVTVPPAITSDPSATTTCAGVSASFAVSASGSGLTYQWSYNGANISGATSATYTITNPQAANIGNYRVTVSNGCGSVPSAPVALTVNPIAGIGTQPINTSVCPGGTVSLSTAANGTGPFTYVWEKEVTTNNWSATGTNSPTLSLSNVTSTAGGNYRVKVTGTCGSQVTSTTATVTVNPTPALPIALDASRCADGPLSITASSPSPSPTFNWYNTDSDATPAFVGSTRNYPTLTVTTVQYVSVVSLGCESGRKQVNFNRFDTKSVDLGAALSLCVAQGVYDLESDIADPLAKGNNFTWVANSVNYSSKLFNPNVGQGTYVVSYSPPASASAAPNCYLPTDRTVIVITDGGNGGLTFTDPKISTGNTVNACVGDAPIVISNYPNVTGGTWSTVTGSGLSNSGSSSVFIPDANNFTSTTPNTFRYTVVTGGCSVSKDLFIFVKDNQSPPAVAGLPAVACPGTLMNLTASVSVPGTFAFEWYKSGNTVPFASGSVLSYTSTINEDLLVRSVNTSFGCRSSSTTVAIRTPFSSGTISVSKNVVNIGDFVKYTYSQNTTGNTYAWDFGDGGSSTEFSPAYYYYKPGQFYTKLKVTSTLGCSQDTQYDFIKVNGTPYSVVTGNEPIAGLPSDTFNVYPIPASSTLNVDGHKGAAYTVFSMSGSAVMKTVAESDNVKIDLSALSPGIYKLLITYGFVTRSVTIVKE